VFFTKSTPAQPDNNRTFLHNNLFGLVNKKYNNFPPKQPHFVQTLNFKGIVATN
jgi:hypothetical protein